MPDTVTQDVMRKLVFSLIFVVLALSCSLFLSLQQVWRLEGQVTELNRESPGGITLGNSSVREPEVSVDLDDPEMSHGTHEWNAQRRELTEAEGNATWKQHSFDPHGSYGFVRFGGYRVGPSEMVTIGLGSLALWGHRRLKECQWVGNEGQVLQGSTKLIYGLEHHGLTYHVLIIWCYLKGKTTPRVGGRLYLDMDYEKYVVYAEGDAELPFSTPRRPFLRNITHCSPPIHHGIHTHLVKIWLEYHMQAGIDHFVMYDVGGVDFKMREMLRPYLEAGVVEITDFRDTQKFPSWYYGQVLIINDCLYRFRFTSQWVAYIDYDEYIWVKGNKTLKDILHEYKDKAYIQHGTVLWRVQKCLEKEGDSDPRSAVERAVFRSPEPFCRDPKIHKPTCYDYWGHRKYFGNPRRLVLVENHRVVTPNEQGVSLSTDVMLHQHLRGLVTHGFRQCNETHRRDEEVAGYVKDTSVADVVRDLRENPLSMEKWVAQKEAWEEHVREQWREKGGE